MSDATTMPGSRAGCGREDAGPCVLCRDVAEEGVAVTVDHDAVTAVVRVGSDTVEIAIDLMDGVRPGDRLLISQGFAVARVAS